MSLSPTLKCTALVANEPAGERKQEKDLHSQSDLILLNCIDAVLTDVLGVKVREAVYDHLARQGSLAKEEIPAHLDDFSELLRNTFGSGATTLEKCIAKKLCSTLGCEFVDVPKFGLQGYVSLIKGIIAREDRKVIL